MVIIRKAVDNVIINSLFGGIKMNGNRIIVHTLIRVDNKYLVA